MITSCQILYVTDEVSTITCKLDFEIHVQVSTDMVLYCCLMILEVFVSLSVAYFWPPAHKMYLHDFVENFDFSE